MRVNVCPPPSVRQRSHYFIFHAEVFIAISNNGILEMMYLYLIQSKMSAFC